MYTQIFLVTSVRGIDFPPQTAANAGLRVFGGKAQRPFSSSRPPPSCQTTSTLSYQA